MKVLLCWAFILSRIRLNLNDEYTIYNINIPAVSPSQGFNKAYNTVTIEVIFWNWNIGNVRSDHYLLTPSCSLSCVRLSCVVSGAGSTPHNRIWKGSTWPTAQSHTQQNQTCLTPTWHTIHLIYNSTWYPIQPDRHSNLTYSPTCHIVQRTPQFNLTHPNMTHIWVVSDRVVLCMVGLRHVRLCSIRLSWVRLRCLRLERF